MKRSGYSDFPLHGGRVPAWLYSRMGKLGSAMVDVIVAEFGPAEFLSRMSDPFWFQSFGAVMGMDWHSSGITTSVLGALKNEVNKRSNDLGLYFCGGRGKHSRATPRELMAIADQTGLDGGELVLASKLSAKVDSAAVQDGFQLYLHGFILSREGDWCVVQQGMNTQSRLARRYHWHSARLSSFVNDPHTSIVGKSVGQILNLVDRKAASSRQGMLDIVHEPPSRILSEIPYLKMPDHHDLRVNDVNLKRLGAMLYLAHETDPKDFESLLLLKGVGPRTLQSLALVSEIIYGTPSRFTDPARFAFAHGGKDGHPFPVPLTVYDETITFLNDIVVKSKIDRSDKIQACRKLHSLAKEKETYFHPEPDRFADYIEYERSQSKNYGGRTVMDDLKKAGRNGPAQNNQLELF